MQQYSLLLIERRKMMISWFFNEERQNNEWHTTITKVTTESLRLLGWSLLLHVGSDFLEYRGWAHPRTRCCPWPRTPRRQTSRCLGRRLPPSVGREVEGETEVHHQKVVQWMGQDKCGLNIRTLLEPVPEKDSWRTAGYTIYRDSDVELITAQSHILQV